MIFTRLSTLVASAILLVQPTALLAQGTNRVTEQHSGLIVGKVLDQDGPILGVTVNIVGTSITDTSDLLGRFRLPKIPPGIHSLSAKALGYIPYQKDSIVVRADISTEVVVRLGPASVVSSSDIHLEERRKALFAFDADTAAGHVILISPFEIAKGESTFARGYGFTFQKNRWSRVFMDAYNTQSLQALEAKHGKGFLHLLDSLWNSVHKQR